MPAPSRSRLGKWWERGGGDLGDVEKLRGSGGDTVESVTEHRVAEGTRCGNHIGAGGDQLLSALHADAFAFLLAHEGQTAARAAAERPLAGPLRFDQFSERRDDGARLVVYVAV